MKTPILVLCLLLCGCGALITEKPTVVINPDGTLTTNLVHSVSPGVTNLSNGINAVAPFVPAPWGTILTALAGVLGTGVASYVATKNKKNADNWAGVASTVIEGVESLGKSADEAKKAVARASVKNGNAEQVHKAVQDVV